MSVPTTVIEVLEQAEQLIRVYGLVSGKWGNDYLGYCLDGALLEACGGDNHPTTFKSELLDQARAKVEQAIRATGFIDPLFFNENQSGMRYIYRYNDQPGR